MSGGVYIVVRCVVLFIDVLTIAMFARAILSWIFMEGENKISNFLYVVTEPIIMPVRALCNKFGWFQGLPMDIPFLITMVLLDIISIFLQAWAGL